MCGRGFVLARRVGVIRATGGSTCSSTVQSGMSECGVLRQRPWDCPADASALATSLGLSNRMGQMALLPRCGSCTCLGFMRRIVWRSQPPVSNASRLRGSPWPRRLSATVAVASLWMPPVIVFLPACSIWARVAPPPEALAAGPQPQSRSCCCWTGQPEWFGLVQHRRDRGSCDSTAGLQMPRHLPGGHDAGSLPGACGQAGQDQHSRPDA